MALPNCSATYFDNMPGVQVTGSSGAQTNATATASLPATPNRTNWIYGFDITTSGTVTPVTATLIGVGSSTLSYQVPATTGIYSVQFNYPLCSTAQNTAITLSVGALGASGVCSCNVYGVLGQS